MTSGLRLLAIWLVVTFMAVYGDWDVMYHLSYGLLLLGIASYVWARLNVKLTDFRRSSRGLRAQVGGPFEERVELKNRTWLPKPWVEIVDHSTLPGHSISRALTLGPWERRIDATRSVCRQRGRFHVGPVLLASGDPFGLFRITRQVAGEQPVVVYPAIVELPAFGSLPGELPGGSVQGERVHFTTPNVASIRDWVPGDSFNRIHWRTTARTGRLVVKEFELDPFSDLWLILDLDRDAHFGRGPESTEEYAVTACAALANRFLNEHRAVGLIGQGHLLTPDRGPRQLNKILELLAVVRIRKSEPLHELLVSEDARFGRMASVVVITATTDEAWVSQVRALSRRGVFTSAVLMESNTFGSQEASILLVASLAAGSVPTYLVKRGEPLASALAQPQVASLRSGR
jgi:uncharacterized protein (DUF58 family)